MHTEAVGVPYQKHCILWRYSKWAAVLSAYIRHSYHSQSWSPFLRGDLYRYIFNTHSIKNLPTKLCPQYSRR